MSPHNPLAGRLRSPAVAVSFSVTVTQVSEDGTEGPVDGELAALAGPAGRMAWAARDAAGLDHGERQKAIEESGRELQRWP